MNYLLVPIAISILLFIQGCNQKNIDFKLQEEVKVIEVELIEKRLEQFLNDKYKADINRVILSEKDYDTEYIHTETKTTVFVKYKDNMSFCNKRGCSGEMFEYKANTIKQIDSFMLIETQIYLFHDFNKYGFSQVIIPTSYQNEDGEYEIVYNIFEPFSDIENETIYPNTKQYKLIQKKLNDRKKSIKLFAEME